MVGLDPDKVYTAQWFDPQSGEYTPIGGRLGGLADDHFRAPGSPTDRSNPYLRSDFGNGDRAERRRRWDLLVSSNKTEFVIPPKDGPSLHDWVLLLQAEKVPLEAGSTRLTATEGVPSRGSPAELISWVQSLTSTGKKRTVRVHGSRLPPHLTRVVSVE